MVQRRPMISIMKPVKNLPGIVTMNSNVLSPKLKVTTAPWSTSAFGSRTAEQK
jgi:hypothetical protein